MESQKYSLAELAEVADITGRKIRYYIAEGVLPGPVSRGRQARYTEEHRNLLGEIQRLQKEGRSLEEIRDCLKGPRPTSVPRSVTPTAEHPTVWEEYGVAEGMQLRLRSDAPLGRRQQFNQILAAARQIVEGRES